MKRRREAGIAAVFLAVLTVYLSTLSRGVDFHDTGDMIASAWFLGVAHPPGFPLFSILGKIFTFLPAGSIASRINLMSAFFGAGASALVYLIAFRSGIGWLGGVVAAMCLAFSRQIWLYSGIAEKYSMNAFFAALLIYLLLCWHREGKTKYAGLFAFFLGLSFAHHPSMVILVPAAVYLMFFADAELLPKRGVVLKLTVLFVLGWSLNFFIIMRAAAHPAHNWSNPSTFSAFIDHVLVRQYRGALFAVPAKMLLDQIPLHLAGYAVKQFTIAGILLALAGAVRIFLKDRKFFWVLVIILSTNVIVGLNYIGPEPVLGSKYYMHYFVAVALLIGFGADVILSFCAKRMWEEPLQNLDDIVGRVVFALLPVFLPVWLIHANYRFADHSSRTSPAEIFGKDIFKSIEPGSVLFVAEDICLFPLVYLTKVEKIRPDISVYGDFVSSFENIYAENFQRLPDREKRIIRDTKQREIISGTRPVYYTLGSNLQNLVPQESKPAGLVFRYTGAASKTQNISPQEFNMKEIDSWGEYGDPRTREAVAHYHFFLAESYFAAGNADRACAEYEIARRYSDEISWMAMQIGIAYYQKKMYKQAREQFEKTVEINPNDSGGWTNLGAVCYVTGDNRQAINCFRHAVGLEDEYLEAHFYLGLALVKSGDFPGAVREMEKTLEIDPAYEPARQNLDTLRKTTGGAQK